MCLKVTQLNDGFYDHHRSEVVPRATTATERCTFALFSVFGWSESEAVGGGAKHIDQLYGVCRWWRFIKMLRKWWLRKITLAHALQEAVKVFFFKLWVLYFDGRIENYCMLMVSYAHLTVAQSTVL